MQDALELIESNLLSTPSLTTWAYFDARNLESAMGRDVYPDGLPVLDFPVPSVYNADGTQPTRKETRSQYWKWIHETNRMTIQQTLAQEANGDDPQTIYDYLLVAMSDCVAQGAEEYMLIFSSHGAGFYGFGGDEDIDRRQRRLTQSNANVVNAIQTALDTVDGAPAQLDVLGFDACLMMSLGALDDYAPVTKYFIASEAVEPGHGWSYSTLTTADSALGMAQEMYAKFLSDPQGDFHQGPKTLAIVDTAKFPAFVAAWESLMASWGALHATDAGFVTLLRRARSTSTAFIAIFDDFTSKIPSALDIGSLLKKFKELCGPVDESAIVAVEQAYYGMFIASGTGPETTNEATGMHVYWPTRSIYATINAQIPSHPELIFDSLVSTTSAPNFLDFLETYYTAPVPGETGTSFCANHIVVDSTGADGDLMLIDEEVYLTPEFVTVDTNVGGGVDVIEIAIGIDFLPILDDRKRRALLEQHDRRQLQGLPAPFLWLESRTRKAPRPRSRRRTQVDVFTVYVNDVFGGFVGNKYSAKWDRTFFLLLGGEELKAFVYALDFGDGSRGIPGVYLPTAPDISEFGLTTDDLLTLPNAVTGVLSFTSTGGLADIKGTTLLTFDQDQTVSELPTNAGGFFVPVLFADFGLGSLVELLGGFSNTVFPWGDDNNKISVLEAPDTFALNTLSLDTIEIVIEGIDEDRYDGISDEGIQTLEYYYTFTPEELSSEEPLTDDVGGETPAPGDGSPPVDEPVNEPPVTSPASAPVDAPVDNASTTSGASSFRIFAAGMGLLMI